VDALRRAPWLAPTAAATVLVPLALLLAFFWVGNDAVDGFAQRIFYLHVPIALTSYACFAYGAWNAVLVLMRRGRSRDLKSYVGVHAGTIWGTLVLITGAIWARTSWGVWWSWSDKQLNVFLLLFLYYCAYFMLRFSIEEGERRETISAVYAILGVGMIPLSFLAVRIFSTLVHPEVFTSSGAAMPGSFLLTFVVALAGMLCLAVGMMAIELRGKRLATDIRELERRRAGTDF
jgi:heme exporter protein C